MSYNIISVQFSSSVVSDSLRPHELQHTRPPCPSPTPRVYPNSCPLSPWCHPAISSSIIPFSSCPQSLPASESFPMSQLFAWDGQSIGVSALASVLPKTTQGWSPLEWTGWISLQSKGLSGVFSNTIVQKHQFFGTQLSSQFNSQIETKMRNVFITSQQSTLSPKYPLSYNIISVQFSSSVVSDSLRPHELQHTRPPCPSPTPGVFVGKGVSAFEYAI